MNQFFLNGYILQHIRNQMLFYSIINICIFNKIVFFIVIFLKSAECINNLIICRAISSASRSVLSIWVVILKSPRAVFLFLLFFRFQLPAQA